MSIWSTRLLCEEEIEELVKSTIFTVSEIEGLFERFKYLVRGSTDFLKFTDFQLIPEFYSNPFGSLIINYLESLNCFETVSFASFLEFMSLFSHKTPMSRRITFLFNIFDLEKKLRITKKDLEKIFYMMTKKEDNQKINDVLEMFDRNGKGYLDLNDFAELYNSDPNLEKNMILDFSKYTNIKKDVDFWQMIWPNKDKKRL